MAFQPTPLCRLPSPIYLIYLVYIFLFYRSLSRDNAENMHFFSSLALTLNEPEEGIAPTDSRLRPDQRLMEAGVWDEANTQKQRLEECQRLERKRREAQANQALEEGENKETQEQEGLKSLSTQKCVSLIVTSFRCLSFTVQNDVCAV